MKTSPCNHARCNPWGCCQFSRPSLPAPASGGWRPGNR